MMRTTMRPPASGVPSWLTCFVAFASLFIGVARANTPPTITGTPPSTIRVGSYYQFVPTASDRETAKRSLRFAIANKPSWSQFNIYSGQIKGVPTSAGTWSNIRISVSDGTAKAYLPAFSITASRAGVTSANSAPVISGAPATSVNVGSSYSFRPSASDPDGNTLGFSIQNRPAWAIFSTTTGQLSGTPAASYAGSYSNIVISVSDGQASRSLPAFNVQVASPVVVRSAPGTATLSWVAPTARLDSAVLTNLAGYRIHYGNNAGILHMTVQVANPGITSYVLQNLTPGTYYFAIRAFDSAGNESPTSNVISTTVR